MPAGEKFQNFKVLPELLLYTVNLQELLSVDWHHHQEEQEEHCKLAPAGGLDSGVGPTCQQVRSVSAPTRC